MRRAERRAALNRRFYTNQPEDAAACCLAGSGKDFSKRGYPDFTVYNSDGSIYGFIEVKPEKHDTLKKAQETFFSFCKSLNIPCIRWSPDEGEDKIRKFLERSS